MKIIFPKNCIHSYLRNVPLLLVVAVLLGCGAENPLLPLLRPQNEVWIVSNGFDPETLTVTVGTTVRWVNQDNLLHDVTGGAPGSVDNSVISPSQSLKSKETHVATFDTRGKYFYFCSKHPSSTGTIMVL